MKFSANFFGTIAIYAKKLKHSNIMALQIHA